MDSLAEKVEGSNDRDTVAESPATLGPATTLWAYRPFDEPLDSLPMLQWDQDEELPQIKGCKLVEVSEGTRKVTKTAFKKPLHNAARLQTKKTTYSLPLVEDTKCPKLDTVMKQNLSKDVKDSDVNVAKLQTLMPDAVAPLVHIWEEAQRGTLTSKTATEAACAALALLENPLAHMTCDRRKRILRDLNKDLLPLAEDEEAFKGAAPLLFGDHLESLKCLQRSIAPRSGQEQFFWKGRSHYLERKRRGTKIQSVPPKRYHQRGKERHF